MKEMSYAVDDVTTTMINYRSVRFLNRYVNERSDQPWSCRARDSHGLNQSNIHV